MTEEEERNARLEGELARLFSSFEPTVGELHVIFATAGMHTGKVAWRGDSRLIDIEIAE